MRIRVPAAFIAGLIGVFAFPPFGLWPLAFVSTAGLSIVVHGRRPRQGAWLGLAFGAGLFGPMLHWTATFVGSAPWLILVFSQTWYVAALGAALPVLQRRRLGPLWAAAGWVGEEALRDRLPFGGFPWGRWAFSQSVSPLKWFAALGGAPLVTFSVALIGCCLARAVLGVRDPGSARDQGSPPDPLSSPDTAHPRGSWFARPARLVPAAGAVTVLALGLALWLPLHPTGTPRSTTIAAIQGDVPDRGLEFNARRRQVLDNHVAQTMKLAAQIKAGTVPKPSLVLWPENASDIDPTTNQDAAGEIQQATDAVGVPILVGALLDGPGPTHVTNAGIVWLPSSSTTPGPGQRYVKRHPVPFGEYMPLRSIARKITSKVDLVARDMVAGSGNGLLTQTPYPVGDVICFEVAYDSLVRSSVRAGAQMLVIQTNNATFGHSGETYQQLAMSRLRAVEHDRSVVQVATSGKSAVIAPDGSVRQESGPLFTADVIVQSVQLRTTTTLATRLGAVPEWLFTALALLGIALTVIPASRRRARVTSLVPAASSMPDKEDG
ncbi:apolipoprotein N-acyltransferase [Jatrophihabitans telluris]|uniref:Apolipoprotein N-acyltransferase n=2 Tax=Jatrophihabitans telluris TaxID=2038343 RepID=A0ABY4QTI1_9ACTN|nr:apolipoprotein N-acyltransferase [Jatrophihabitans telluris]UQX86668.1 apolipoprotein N-acyltransferase [Jatrophihabitans telluris]